MIHPLWEGPGSPMIDPGDCVAAQAPGSEAVSSLTTGASCAAPPHRHRREFPRGVADDARSHCNEGKASASQKECVVSVIAALRDELPRGPKVIQAMAETLGLPDDALELVLELTWRSPAEPVKLSSASVLHVPSDTMDKRPPSGSPGMQMATGPGFCAEPALLRWQ